MTVKGATSKLPAMRLSSHWGEAALAAMLLIPASLPMLVTGLIVWRSLGRPVFFRQSRSGVMKSQLDILKFRTMSNARDASGALLPDAQRLNWIMVAIRKFRFDELPQLLMILRGQMAFIGPRPLLPESVDAMGELGIVRASVRPGLTGWSQVNGNTKLTESQKLALDIWYINHRSLWLDLKIICLTAWTVLRGEHVNGARLKEAEQYTARRGRATSSNGSF